MSVCAPRVDGPCPTETEAAPSIRIRPIRPSVLDPGLESEPGLGQCVCMPNVAVLYMMNRPVAVIQATAMDQVSLERWLARIRSHWPRSLIA